MNMPQQKISCQTFRNAVERVHDKVDVMQRTNRSLASASFDMSLDREPTSQRPTRNIVAHQLAQRALETIIVELTKKILK